MGGAMGALEAPFIHTGDASMWVAISMAAMMGGTMRSPLTAVMFLLELTHDMNLLPALLIGCVAAHTVTVLLMKRSILTEKVARRGYHVAREYVVNPLERFRVEDVMDRDVPTVPAETRADVIFRRLLQHDPVLGATHAWPLVDATGCFVGLVTRGDLIATLDRDADAEPTLLEIGTRTPVVAWPDELLADALDRMISAGVGRLPVVDPADPTRLVGMLGRSGLAEAYAAVHEEENRRESRWTRRRLHTSRTDLTPQQDPSPQT